jgi:GH24 family phage-related lysozyme (muramidase)
MSTETNPKEPYSEVRPFLPRFKKVEGSRLNKAKTHHVAYQDHKGYYTIGYGHLLGKSLEAAKKSPYWGKQLTEAEAENIALKDLKEKKGWVDRTFKGNFNSWNPSLQQETMMAVARGSLPQSGNTIRLMKKNQFGDAAPEFLDSDEYRKSVAAGTGIAPRMRAMHDALLKEGKRQKEIKSKHKRVLKKAIPFSEAVEQRFKDLLKSK